MLVALQKGPRKAHRGDAAGPSRVKEVHFYCGTCGICHLPYAADVRMSTGPLQTAIRVRVRVGRSLRV